jgi:hypothetical protein
MLSLVRNGGSTVVGVGGTMGVELGWSTCVVVKIWGCRAIGLHTAIGALFQGNCNQAYKAQG